MHPEAPPQSDAPRRPDAVAGEGEPPTPGAPDQHAPDAAESDLAQYHDLLRRDATEVAQLLKDLLINVTAFFRDPEAFEELRHQAIAPLLQAKPTEEPVRAWVAGCATGEEAYSLALLLAEEVAAARKHCAVQVPRWTSSVAAIS